MEPDILLDLPAVRSWPAFAVAVVLAVAAAVLAAVVVRGVMRVLSRRRGWDQTRVGRIVRPVLTLISVIGLWVAIAVTLPERKWEDAIDHIALILVIVAIAWLIAGIIGFAVDAVRARYPVDVVDNRIARRIRTQLDILHRLASVVLVILAAGAILLTFPGVQALGASVLASAGLVSVIAGLAAQSTLANVFAGIQLAFSDAIRVDDVVVVENEWGRIEEMTLSYVVVRIWDDRRLVLPSTYFTTTPFTNWTRNSSAITGTVFLDLDWTVPLDGLREHFTAFVAERPEWDGRASAVEITDARGGVVQVRLLVTAVDSGTLWKLQCAVREEMVIWAQSVSPLAVPRTRVAMIEDLAEN
ncbi:mechanosensitive ion channel family protein [Homoserinibacter sp. GY 40078]|uniref:mechanosensitive ion channel family protein n=1 Tax=Homoserinibacter sp. GY 40078 TaxID=2603275 RepID=UPI0011C6F28E|nr:mechanosensitive ion channel family protein [Homoserinibacter sp. GY 40078]TXK18734.1 mechanosensitive ion channel family protein [Homoserinibacter sp. GY 40078]